MEPGLDLIIHCPHCDCIVLQRSLNSGNTLGAVLWTDMKMDAVMLPVFPDFTRCKKCRKFFWVDTVNASESDSYGDSSLPYVRKIMINEYQKAIESHLWSSKDQEIQLRIEFWRSVNDIQRYRDEIGLETACKYQLKFKVRGASLEDTDPSLNDLHWLDLDQEALVAYLISKLKLGSLDAVIDEIEPEKERNLETLLDLIQEIKSYATLRVEMLRELGRFAEAHHLLESLRRDSEIPRDYIKRMDALIKSQDRKVQKLPSEAWEHSDSIFLFL